MSLMPKPTEFRSQLVEGAWTLNPWLNYGLVDYVDPHQPRTSAIRLFRQHWLEPKFYCSGESLFDRDLVVYLHERALELAGRFGDIAAISAGSVLRISQRSGDWHEFYNASDSQRATFFEIFIAADAVASTPSYEIKLFPETEKRRRWRLIASRGGRNGALALRADVNIYATLLEDGETLRHALDPGRVAWLHAAYGWLEVNGQTIDPGVGLKLVGGGSIDVVAKSPQAEALLFDIAA